MAESFSSFEKGIAEGDITKDSLMFGWRIAKLNVIDKSKKRILMIGEPYWQNEDMDMRETARTRLYDIYMEYRSH